MQVHERDRVLQRAEADLRGHVVSVSEFNALTALETLAVLTNIARDYVRYAVKDERDMHREIDSRPHRD